MKPYQKINWYEKDINDVYDFIYDDLEEEDQYPFFEWLMQYFPNLEINWIDTFMDFKEYLLEDEKPEKIISFAEFCKIHCPEDYRQRYGFIESDLCDWYLYKNDFGKLKERIDFIQQNPVPAIDTLTARLLYQLIYHGQYPTAVSYAEAVWKPVNESKELMGFAAYRFISTVYVSQLQKCYEAHRNQTSFDEQKLFEQIVLMGFNNTREDFEEILNALKEEKTGIAGIETSTSKKKDGLMRVLNIHFLKYMWDTYGLPFIFSELIWDFIATTKIFGKQEDAEDWFYIDAGTLDKHIMSNLDTFIFSNNLEIFGKVWGLDFVFEFLHHYQLLSDERYENMLENIAYFRNELIKISGYCLWEMMFVFEWPHTNNYALDPSLKRLFNETYGISEEDAIEKVRRYLSVYFVPERVKEELHFTKKEKNEKLPFWSEETPYMKQGEDVGRNDPCPCGSGKKYKKCCMNK